MLVRDSTQSVSIFPQYLPRWSTSKAPTSSTNSWQMWYSLERQSSSVNSLTTIGNWGTMGTLVATRQILLHRTLSEKKSVNRPNCWACCPLLKQNHHLNLNQLLATSLLSMALGAQETRRKRKPMLLRTCHQHRLLNSNSIIVQLPTSSISFKRSKRLSLSRL